MWKVAPLHAPLLLLITAWLSACGGSDNRQRGAEISLPGDYADGWTQVELQANWAKTTFTLAGHFTTSRNGCGRPADGVLDQGAWARAADALNQIANLPAPAQLSCMDLQENSKLDGSAAMVLYDGSKRTILEMRGGQLCTVTSNAALARQLFEALSHVVTMADREECPNGWGSG